MFDVWKNVLAELEREIPASAFETWFTDVELLSVQRGVVTIGGPNIFKTNQLEKKFDKKIKAALKNNSVEFSRVEYIVKSGKKSKTRARETTGREMPIGEMLKRRKIAVSQPEVVRFSTGLKREYTMDNFVIGSNNDLAVSVARGVIEQPGEKFNPFFLYGGPGLGKTHLVQAIGNALLDKNPKLKVLYTPINHFYSEFVNRIKKNQGDEFAAKYRKLDVLIIDDFQFIVGKDRSQEEFFNIFNDLHQANKQIIVTSDRLPSQIETVDERLASRLTWAGAIDLQFPDFEDKCAILKSKAEFRGVEIEDEAIEYLAENVKTNIRDLESEFMRLLAVAELKGISPLEVIGDGYINPVHLSRTKQVAPKQVIDKTARHFDISAKELKSKCRVANIKTARQVAMYILSKELGMSTNKIAAEVGVKDHTTVLHGVKKIENDLKLNFGLREDIASIREELYG